MVGWGTTAAGQEALVWTPSGGLERLQDRLDTEYGIVLDDMRPYERLIGNGLIAGVMLAHIVYREMDEMPAGFSQFWIERELRSRLGFGGAVFCDDLSMKATRDYGTMAERAKRALAAGCDMVLVCKNASVATLDEWVLRRAATRSAGNR